MTKELDQNWYQDLVEECKGIITEAVFTSRWALVEGYWELGKRIETDDNFKKFSKGNQSSLQDLANNLSISERTLYYALQVYDKYPDIQQIPEGKNITWNKLITKYLPDPQSDKPIILPEKVKSIIKQGDFRKLIKELSDNSIDLILTDPPYPKEFLPLWEDLAKEAIRVLKPGGFLITYSGTCHLPEVISSLGKYLDYYYTIILYHKGGTGQNFSVNMWDRAKPIFIYYKEPRTKQETWIENLIESPTPDKNMHKWGQGVEPFIKLIETFSQVNDKILDPFMGAGVVLEACAKTNRHFIGYEIKKEFYNLVQRRINDPAGNN